MTFPTWPKFFWGAENLAIMATENFNLANFVLHQIVIRKVIADDWQFHGTCKTDL